MKEELFGRAGSPAGAYTGRLLGLVVWFVLFSNWQIQKRSGADSVHSLLAPGVGRASGCLPEQSAQGKGRSCGLRGLLLKVALHPGSFWFAPCGTQAAVSQLGCPKAKPSAPAGACSRRSGRRAAVPAETCAGGQQQRPLQPRGSPRHRFAPPLRGVSVPLGERGGETLGPPTHPTPTRAWLFPAHPHPYPAHPHPPTGTSHVLPTLLALVHGQQRGEDEAWPHSAHQWALCCLPCFFFFCRGDPTQYQAKKNKAVGVVVQQTSWSHSSRAWRPSKELQSWEKGHQK